MKIHSINTYNKYNYTAKTNCVNNKTAFGIRLEETYKEDYNDMVYITPFIKSLKAKLGNELPNIKAIRIENTLQNEPKNEKLIHREGNFYIGFEDGLIAKETILKQQSEYQTIPTEILKALKNNNPVIADRIAYGGIKIHFPELKENQGSEDDYFNRCATKIRRYARLLPEILLTKDIDMAPNGDFIDCAQKLNMRDYARKGIRKWHKIDCFIHNIEESPRQQNSQNLIIG